MRGGGIDRAKVEIYRRVMNEIPRMRVHRSELGVQKSQIANSQIRERMAKEERKNRGISQISSQSRESRGIKTRRQELLETRLRSDVDFVHQ